MLSVTIGYEGSNMGNGRRVGQSPACDDPATLNSVEEISIKIKYNITP